MPKENPTITIEDHYEISEKGTMTNGGPRPISRYFITNTQISVCFINICLIIQFIYVSSNHHICRRNSVYDDSHHTSNAEIDYMSFDRISTTVQYLEKRTQMQVNLECSARKYKSARASNFGK